MAASDVSHWYNLRGQACASAVKGLADDWERDQSQRRIRMRRNIELFEGMRLAGLSPSSWFSNIELSSDDWDVLRVNIARGLVHTAVAKIAGKQKPKTQFVVNDGDWSVKIRAKKMERFVEANMLARQGYASDAYELGLEAERDCCVADLGVLKYEPNLERKCVDITRRLPWSIMCDPLDAQNGQPQSLVEVYPYDRFKLAAKFPKHKDAILGAPEISGESGAQDFYGSAVVDNRSHVLVREAYRLPFTKDKPGRRALIVGTADLADEDWELDFFPYEFFVWEKRFTGLYGASIVDNVYHLVGELNAAIQRMSDAERHGSHQVVVAEENSLTNKSDVEGNLARTLILHKQGSPAPIVTTPNAISSSTVQWWGLLHGQCFEIPGVSQMGATGQKDPGVDAAVAMRTIENIATERFAPQWQAYERRMSVGSARQIIACGKIIAEHAKEKSEPYIVKHKRSNGFLEDLELSDFALEEDKYQIQPYAVSGLTNTPADRLSLATELLDRGIISQDGYLRVIQAKDIDAELARTNTWSQLVEKYIESWREATPETEASGKFRYRPPVKFMPLADLIVQVGRAYGFAEMEEAPDYNLGFFIRFMGDCDREIQKMKAQEAALAAQAKGAMAPPPMDPNALPPPDMAVPPEALPPGGVLQ